jgi:hypothetical protein
LRKKKDGGGYYVLTSIAGKVITFQLSEGGQRRLLGASLVDGDRFARAILFDLYRSGDAFTHGSGITHQIKDERQLPLDFADDTTPESVFPSCSKCAAGQGLYLVTAPDDNLHNTYILCDSCRKARLAQSDISIPLAIVSRSILAQLRNMGHISRPDAKVAHYAENLEMDVQKKWDELRKRKTRRQKALFVENDPSQKRLIE